MFPQVLRKMDFNQNWMVDRCETAMLLESMGNTEEYSKKFSFHADLNSAQKYCDQMFDVLYM